MFELQNIEKIEIKYQPKNKCFYIFTFLPFVAWLTDWCVKQKVRKESKKQKKRKNLETFMKYFYKKDESEFYLK